MGTFDWLEEIASYFQSGIGAVVTLWGETHGGAVGAAGVGIFVISGIVKMIVAA